MPLRYLLVLVIGVVAGYFLPKFFRAALDNDVVGVLSDCLVAELRARLPQGFRGAWKSWASLVGAAICEASAGVICFFFQGSTYDSIIPLGFLLIVVACARRFGALAGVLGSITAAGTFAVYLFAPVGRLAVSQISGRTALGILVIGGIVLSYYLASDRSQKHAAVAGASR